MIILWADLFVTALSGSGFTVTNVGSADTGPFTVRVTWLATVAISQTFSFDGLAGGASETRSFPCVSGLLVAVADADEQIAESDEANTTQISATC